METESRFLYGDGVETSSISTSASDQKSQKSPAGSIHTLPWKLLEGHLLSFLSFRLQTVTLHPPFPLLQQRPETEKPETEILTLLFSSTLLPRGPQKLRRQKLSLTLPYPSRGRKPETEKPTRRWRVGTGDANDPSVSSWRAARHRPSWRGESAPLERRCRVALLRSSRSRRRRRFRPARAGTWRLRHAGNTLACLALSRDRAPESIGPPPKVLPRSI